MRETGGDATAHPKDTAMKPTFLAAGVLALALATTACGAADQPAFDPVADPGAGTCLEGTPDCDDTGILDGAAGERCRPEAVDCHDTPDGDAPMDATFDTEAALADAEAVLGLTEVELGADVRVGRRGEESMMLIEDYRLGRLTVDLDLDDMDRWVVTAVTVELPDGPQTLSRPLG